MANNQYVNKVQFGNTTIMDISNTNAEAGDVLEGALFYAKSGAPTTGTLGDATQSTHGLMSTTDKIKLDSMEDIHEAFNMLVGDYTITTRNNLYDTAIQTNETISPHYFVSGAPYSSTQFDSSWNCTNFIPVEPSTEYTVGLVPSVNNVTKPWNNAGYGWFAYDSEKTYISTGTNNTFTTPSNCAYIRFNYHLGTVDLDSLNTRCMLVKGDTLPVKYSLYGKVFHSTLSDLINNSTFEYKKLNTYFLIAYAYNEEYKLVVLFNKGRANSLFDFAGLALIPSDELLKDYDLTLLNNIIWSSTGTDMHSPFQFNAVNNADGYHSDSTSPGWVGGNHTLDQLGAGYETATSKYIHILVDGMPAQSYGRGNKLEIRWANDIQAYNTVKQGGGGRACLTEYHDMIFDGIEFKETVKLVALEDINMWLWYGFQFVSWTHTYNKIRYIDGTNHGIYTEASSASGNPDVSGMEIWGPSHKLIMTINTNSGMGKHTYIGNSDSGAFTAGDKGYFRIINKYGNLIWYAGEAYYLKGTYRFMPVLEYEDEGDTE